MLQTEFPTALSEIEAELRQHGQWHGRVRHRIRDGRTLIIATHWALQRNASGQPAGVAEVNTGISDHEKAEGALLRLAAIVGSSHDAVIAKTLDGTITDWNQAAETLFGRSAGEIIGRSVVVLFPTERIGEEAAILKSIRDGRRVETFETERLHKDGRIIPVSITISPILDANLTIVGASKIVRDLSERVERDRHFLELQAQLAHVSPMSRASASSASSVPPWSMKSISRSPPSAAMWGRCAS